MLLFTESCYNPFFTNVNGRTYEIDKIHFFDDNGIICTNNCGWFGSNNNHRKGLSLPCDCVVKRKPDFTLEGAFILPGNEKSWYKNQTRYELYIRAAVVGLKAPTYKKQNDGRAYYIDYKSDIEGVFVSVYCPLDKELVEIEMRMQKLLENMRIYSIKPERLEAFSRDFNKIKREWQKEYNRMQAVVIDSEKGVI